MSILVNPMFAHRIWHEVGHLGHSQLDTIAEDTKGNVPRKGDDNLSNRNTTCPQIGQIFLRFNFHIFIVYSNPYSLLLLKSII